MGYLARATLSCYDDSAWKKLPLLDRYINFMVEQGMETEGAQRARFTNLLFNKTDELISIIEAHNLTAEEAALLQKSIIFDFIPHMRESGISLEIKKKVNAVADALNTYQTNTPTKPR